MKNRFLQLLGIGILLFLTFAFSRNKQTANSINNSLTLKEYYSVLVTKCNSTLNKISTNSSKAEQIENYKEARKFFKKLEPIMAYVSTEDYETLNQANLIGVEELGEGKTIVENAFGFQVIEEILYSETKQANELNISLTKTKKLLQLVSEQEWTELTLTQVLELLRNQIIRTATLGVTGFDSPQKQSLLEAEYNYDAISSILEIYQEEFDNQELREQWEGELEKMQKLGEQNFNTFDRYGFIQNNVHYQLALIQRTSVDWGVLLPKSSALQASASSLFSKNTFRSDFFVKSEYQYTSKRSAIGEQLFNDAKISKTGKMSCATCHQKDKAFTDGLAHFEGQKRNTPSLFYSGLQNEYFYDMRSGSLQEQIVQVVENKNEFHSDLATITKKILEDTSYAKRFEVAYESEISDDLVLDALSQYVKSLNPFNSKFDRNINKEENSLTVSEKNGFNLFMGKAECGTCHFAPVFNGTVPPYFTTTEMELLGVPKDSTKKKLDTDYGRYDVHATENRKHFFKTPTVRNVSKTAPYMHNGAFNTLFEVVEFYDDGGGVGIGFDLAYQTLPSDSLKLTTAEIQDIIAFLNSLEDDFVDDLQNSSSLN